MAANITITSVAENLNVPIIYKYHIEDHYNTVMSLPVDAITRIIQRYHKDYGTGVILTNVIKKLKRLGYYELLDESVLLATYYLDLSSPNDYLLFFSAVLDYNYEFKRKATFREVMMYVFPKGFYDENSSYHIVTVIRKQAGYRYYKLYI